MAGSKGIIAEIAPQFTKWGVWAAVSSGTVGKLLAGRQFFSVVFIPSETTFLAAAAAGAVPTLTFLLAWRISSIVLKQEKDGPKNQLEAFISIVCVAAPTAGSIGIVSYFTGIHPASVVALSVLGLLSGSFSRHLKGRIPKRLELWVIVDF